MNGFGSLTRAPMETRKKQFFSIIAMVNKSENECSIKKVNLINMHYH